MLPGRTFTTTIANVDTWPHLDTRTANNSSWRHIHKNPLGTSEIKSDHQNGPSKLTIKMHHQNGPSKWTIKIDHHSNGHCMIGGWHFRARVTAQVVVRNIRANHGPTRTYVGAHVVCGRLIQHDIIKVIIVSVAIHYSHYIPNKGSLMSLKKGPLKGQQQILILIVTTYYTYFELYY